MDEPWSRPGDYVLLRAMTTSSARRRRARTTSTRPTAGSAPTSTCASIRRQQLLDGHRASRDPGRGARADQGDRVPPALSGADPNFVEYRGYWLPHCFNNEGAIAEYWACREKAVVMDLSPLRKWEVLGPDAEALIQRDDHARRPPARGRPGRLHGALQRDRRDDRRRDGLPPRARQLPLRRRRRVRRRLAATSVAEERGLKAWVKPSTDQLHNLAVQGPLSREILKRVRLDAADPAAARGAQVVPLPRRADRRLRRDPGRRLAHRLHRRARLRGLVPPRRRRGRVGRDLAAGAPTGLMPLGLEALDMLRIESGLIFAGYEFDDQVDPFEAGIGFTVDARHDEDFVGREALMERQGASAAARSSASSSRATRRRPRRLRLRGAPAASASSRAARAARSCEEVDRAVPDGRRSTPRSAPRSRSASSTGIRSGSRRRSCAFPFYDPEKKRPRS